MLLGVTALLPGAGCSSPVGVAITDRTLALVAAEHVGRPSYAVGEAYGMASEFAGELTKTTLVYPTPDPPPGATETEVQVALYGALLTEDPRTAELPVDLDDLVAAAQDPRLDTTTSPEVVDAAEQLDFWRAGRVTG